MVTLEKFRDLPMHRKCTLITYHGVLLARKVVGNNKVFLFHLNDFFTEFWYHPKRNKIMGINCFRGTKGLDLYLKGININALKAALN